MELLCNRPDAIYKFANGKAAWDIEDEQIHFMLYECIDMLEQVGYRNRMDEWQLKPEMEKGFRR